jgi:hypothetical protein
MTSLWAFIVAHQTIASLTAYFLFSNFVSALPSPNMNSNGFYKWAFAFSTSIGAALPRLFPSLRLNDPTSGTQTYFGKPPDPAAVAQVEAHKVAAAETQVNKTT